MSSNHSLNMGNLHVDLKLNGVSGGYGTTHYEIPGPVLSVSSPGRHEPPMVTVTAAQLRLLAAWCESAAQVLDANAQDTTHKD